MRRPVGEGPRGGTRQREVRGTGWARSLSQTGFERKRGPQDLIQKLLERKATQRLGCLEGSVNDIKNHPWFNGFDWAALSQRKMPAPNLTRKKKDAVDAAEEAEDLANLFQENPDETEAERREATITFKDF